MLIVWTNYVTPWHVWRHTWRQRNDVSSNSQCRHEEDMCANKRPKNDGCIFNGSRDIQQTSTLGLTDPARVPVLQTEREFHRVNATALLKNWKKQHFICSNLTLFIVPFSLFFFFFSLFSFFLSFFSFFSFSLGGDTPSPPKWRPCISTDEVEMYCYRSQNG